jgi:hypothetical protein
VLALSIGTYTLAVCLSEDPLPFRSLDKCSCVLLLELLFNVLTQFVNFFMQPLLNH